MRRELPALVAHTQIKCQSDCIILVRCLRLRRLKRSGDGYVLDGEVRQFEKHTETIRVLQSDGTHTEETLEICRSIHGPVVRTHPWDALRTWNQVCCACV